MNIVLFDDGDKVGSQRIRVTDQRLTNLLQIQQAEVGSELKVGEINGRLGTGTVAAIDKHGAELDITLTTPAPPKLPLQLIIALPRPKMLRRILRTVAELGVADLHLINSYRVEKSYWQTPVLQTAQIKRYLLEGLTQCCDTIVPEVQLHKGFKPFAEDVLPGIAANTRALVAHPAAREHCPRNISSAVTLCIGPEGGFIDYEIDKLKAAGCSPVSLGPRILRVENAVNTLIGRLF